MAAEQQAINITDIPALRDIAAEVTRTRKRRTLAVDGEDVTLIVAPKATTRGRRGKRTSADDPFWKLVGLGSSGKHDLSANHDHYLAEAKMSTTP